MLGSVVWKRVGGRIPGRVLKGRRGSIDGVEKIVVGGMSLLGEVFTGAFDTKDRREAATEDVAEGAGGAGYWVTGAKNKMNSIRSLTSDIFNITATVSFRSKGPLIRFLARAQTRNA